MSLQVVQIKVVRYPSAEIVDMEFHPELRGDMVFAHLNVCGYSINIPCKWNHRAALLTTAYFLWYAVAEGDDFTTFSKIVSDGVPISALAAHSFGRVMKLEKEAGAFLNKLKYAIENPRKTKKIQLL